MKPLVVKPSRGRMVLMVLASIVFTLTGIVMLFSGRLMYVVFGLVAIVLFGVGGVVYVKRALSQRTFTLDERGLHPGGGGFVPWEHIGHVGPTKAGGANALGIEVLDVPAYLDTLTEEQKRLTLRGASFGQKAGAATGQRDLNSMPTDDLESVMAWAKQSNGGYDLAFASLSLGASVDKTAQIIEDYRQQATQSPEGGPTASPTE